MFGNVAQNRIQVQEVSLIANQAGLKYFTLTAKKIAVAENCRLYATTYSPQSAVIVGHHRIPNWSPYPKDTPENINTGAVVRI
jgi:hypothetical protein